VGDCIVEIGGDESGQPYIYIVFPGPWAVQALIFRTPDILLDKITWTKEIRVSWTTTKVYARYIIQYDHQVQGITKR
jgi:membrane-anchored glycerophosphoryl diester phosphodiesterase (GDPDase)